MVEYFMKTAPPPSDQGELYDWMEVRADTVKTRNLQLVSDSGPIPSISGLPGSRLLFIRYRNDFSPNTNIPCTLPANEYNIYHEILHHNAPNDITVTPFSTNGARLGHLPGGESFLSLEFHQPPKCTWGFMVVTIDFLISSLEQLSNSIPNGQQILFNILAFQASQPDFSDESPLGSDDASDRLLIAVNPGSTETNKQICRFLISTPENDTATQVDYYVRFKICRYTQGTTDDSLIMWNQVTLMAQSFDSQ